MGGVPVGNYTDLLWVNGENAYIRTKSFTLENTGITFIVVSMGSTAGSGITCKIRANSNQKELSVNTDTGHTTIDNYHDNDATTFTAKSYLNKGDKVTVYISVGSNINDTTANIRIYN